MNLQNAIGGIKLTIKEIDIISCILNLRGTKKIAGLLSLSPRTVEGHIKNIMLKLRCNSRDSIVDYFEKSVDFKFIKDHYLNLLIRFAFENQLRNISYLTKKCKFWCYINEQDFKNHMFLIKHLELAGINISHDKSDYGYNLYVVLKKNIELILEDKSIKKNQEAIFLIMDDMISKSDLEKFGGVKDHLVDFSSKEQYFDNVFKLLTKLLIDIDCNKFITKFEQLRTNIIASQAKGNPELLLNSSNIVNLAKNTISTKFLQRILKVGGVVCLMVLFIIIFLHRNIKSNETAIKDRNYEIISSIFSLSKDFSANNTTKEQIYKNYNFAKQLENILQNNKKEIQVYFNNLSIPSNELVDFLYSLHALASYYVYNYYDGKKANEILSYVKNLTENYITSYSKISFNFDELKPEEIYVEFSIIKDLPEMYTRIIYLLGRTYIYQGRSEEAKKYFELSKFLGKKLGLFEAYLSDISGLEVIKRDQIDIDIKNGNYEQAKKNLHESIKIYKKLKHNDKEYKVDYKPGITFQKTIIPQKHVYNQVECGKKIAELYSRLATITTDINEKANYIKEIEVQFLETGTGVLILLDGLIEKKVATVYNSLGNILLQLYDGSLYFEQFIEKVALKLNLATRDSLKIIEQVFKLAELYGRNTEYVKADSYNGLMNVYQKEVDMKTQTKEEETKLLMKISELRKKRNYINKNLNRNYENNH